MFGVWVARQCEQTSEADRPFGHEHIYGDQHLVPTRWVLPTPALLVLIQEMAGGEG